MALLSGLVCAGLLLALDHIDIDVNIFDSNGYVSHVNGLLRVLVGFYVASLGLVHTLSDKRGNVAVSGLKWQRREGGQLEVSRKEFLASLFGYLTAASLVLYGLGMIGAILLSPLLETVLSPAELLLDCAFVFIYSLLFAHIILSSSLALYYLSDRLIRPVLDVETQDIPSVESDDTIDI